MLDFLRRLFSRKNEKYNTNSSSFSDMSFQIAQIPPAPTTPAPRMSLRRFSPMTYLPPNDYTVIDLETTGLDACICEILEIGAIRFRQHQEVERFHSYIRPEGAISEESVSVHHITWAKVYQAPSLEEVSSSLFSFLGNDILVGYNIGFDIKFLQTHLGMNIKNKSFDVLPFIRSVVENLPNYKLDTVKNYFRVFVSSHSALSDCVATAQVFQKALDTPKGQEYVRQQQAEAEAEARLKAEHDAILAKRKAAKAQEPSQKELRALSKKMQGTKLDYFKVVFSMLSEAGISTKEIKMSAPPRYENGCDLLQYGWHSFFGVKDQGNLKYILLPIPQEDIQCTYPCTQASMNEGVSSTRIYVQSPDDLLTLKSYIIAAYKKARSDEMERISELERAQQERDESLHQLAEEIKLKLKEKQNGGI